MLETTKDEMEKRTMVVAPTDMIVEFHDLVNRRLEVNLSVLEIVLYSSMVINAEEGNYALPKEWTESNLGAMRLVMANRSLAAQMAYQNHRQTFVDPTSYTLKNRMNHIFDHVLMPEYFNDHPNEEF